MGWRVALLPVSVLWLCACGGGGSTGAALAFPSATPSPSAAPSASPSLAVTLTSLDDGSPLAGAAVSLGGAAALTDSLGRATVPAQPAPSLLVAVAAGYATLHATVTPAAGLVAYKLTKPSAEEAAWVAQINADRAAYGGAPALALDEYAEEAARFKVQDEAARGYYGHGDPQTGAEVAALAYQSRGGIGLYHDLLGAQLFRDWSAVEAQFVAEGPPPPGQSNHFSDLTSANALWAGVGIAGGKNFDPATYGTSPMWYYCAGIVRPR